MKKILFLFFPLVLLSCNNNSSNKTSKKSSNNDTTSIEQINKSVSVEGGCDEFLDDYEKWVDEVIKVYKKVKENPMDMQNTQKMMDATTKMAEWSEKWTKLYDCANNEKYAKRMDELQEKVNKAMTDY